MNNKGKQIAYNTFFVYGRLVITTLLGLFSTRLVIDILGINDYGIYNAVGGIVSILNIFCTAMHTTTRRYINVEMCKSDGCVNKVFNICLRIHLSLAFVFFCIAEILGFIYINEFLVIDINKVNDALFIYHVSLLVACIGLINVPYQSLIIAKERFFYMSLIDISAKILLFILLIILYHVKDVNYLRLYSLSMCMTSAVSFLLYSLYCKKHFSKDIEINKYKDKYLYKEILIFNNYIALGAISYMTRTQGAIVIINNFFGTLINGVYAIASQIESYLILFVSNLSTAAGPQITNLYSSEKKQKALDLVITMNKMSILLMLFICYILNIELSFLLKLWLGDIQDYVLIFTRLTLLSAFIRSFGEGIPPLIQASGNIKPFQISSVIFTLLDLPISILLFCLGYPPQYIIIVFCISSLCSRIVSIFLLYKVLSFDVLYFLKKSYLPIIKVIPMFCIYHIIYHLFNIESILCHIVGLMITALCSVILIFIFGLIDEERYIIINYIKRLK